MLDGGGEVGVEAEAVEARRLGQGGERAREAGEGHELVAGGGLGRGGHGGVAKRAVWAVSEGGGGGAAIDEGGEGDEGVDGWEDKPG